jgi:hypothetical protein
MRQFASAAILAKAWKIIAAYEVSSFDQAADFAE